MKGELWRYSRRELNNVLSVSGDEQFRATILMYVYMAACKCVEMWIWAKALEELLVMRGLIRVLRMLLLRILSIR